MFVSINQQISRHTAWCRRNKKGYAISFRIPICASAIFFAGESFGTNIKPFVLARVSLVQVEYIKPDSLLDLDVTLYNNVTVAPDLRPFRFMSFQQGIEPNLICR